MSPSYRMSVFTDSTARMEFFNWASDLGMAYLKLAKCEAGKVTGISYRQIISNKVILSALGGAPTRLLVLLFAADLTESGVYGLPSLLNIMTFIRSLPHNNKRLADSVTAAALIQMLRRLNVEQDHGARRFAEWVMKVIGAGPPRQRQTRDGRRNQYVSLNACRALHTLLDIQSRVGCDYACFLDILFDYENGSSSTPTSQQSEGVPRATIEAFLMATFSSMRELADDVGLTREEKGVVPPFVQTFEPDDEEQLRQMFQQLLKDSAEDTDNSFSFQPSEHSENSTESESTYTTDYSNLDSLSQDAPVALPESYSDYSNYSNDC